VNARPSTSVDAVEWFDEYEKSFCCVTLTTSEAVKRHKMEDDELESLFHKPITMAAQYKA
jgi:hypothetical protein